MYCTKCGTKLPRGARFCVNCGKPVAAIVPAKVVEPMDAPAKAVDPAVSPEGATTSAVSPEEVAASAKVDVSATASVKADEPADSFEKAAVCEGCRADGCVPKGGYVGFSDRSGRRPWYRAKRPSLKRFFTKCFCKL